MATRSRIGIENQDGTVSSIYCHFDGYESGVGAILKVHYTNREKVQSLIDLGDISSLNETIEETVAYHRDRGERLHKARVDASIEAFGKSDFEEYGRVFTLEGEWITFR
jgi:hypothetical protein